jgi:hypothetical protein
MVNGLGRTRICLAAGKDCGVTAIKTYPQLTLDYILVTEFCSNGPFRDDYDWATHAMIYTMTGYNVDRGAHMAVLWTIRLVRLQRFQDMFRSR